MYTGATLGTYNAGTYQTLYKNLAFQNNSNFNISTGSALSWVGDTTLNGNANFSTGVATTLTGNITGTGGITKSGGSALTLAGSQNYSGLTTVSSNTLNLSGSGIIGNIMNNATLVALDGTHTVGTISGTGVTTLSDNAVLNSGDISSTGAITIGSNAALHAGNIARTGSAALTLNSNALLTAGDINSTGNTTLGSGASLTANSMIQNTVTLGIGARITIAPIPGGPTAGASSLTAVPEPSTWAMLMLAAMGLGMYWRRSR